MHVSKFINIQNLIHIWIYIIMMETFTIQNPSESECYTPSSELFRIYFYCSTVFSSITYTFSKLLEHKFEHCDFKNKDHQ
jgi:hypothetical protein